MLEDTPNWVKARAECTAADCLTQIIGQIKRDIAAFNSLGPERRGKFDLKQNLPILNLPFAARKNLPIIAGRIILTTILFQSS